MSEHIRHGMIRLGKTYFNLSWIKSIKHYKETYTTRHVVEKGYFCDTVENIEHELQVIEFVIANSYAPSKDYFSRDTRHKYKEGTSGYKILKELFFD